MQHSISYKTKQREAMLSLLRERSDAHMTADEICFLLGKTGANVSQTTVYRYLDALVSEGTVRKFNCGDGEKACFQIVSDTCHEHFHLKCTECGKLIHLECKLIEELEEHIFRDHGFSINKERTVFYGLCEKCREKANTTEE